MPIAKAAHARYHDHMKSTRLATTTTTSSAIISITGMMIMRTPVGRMEERN
jgi:hypothetical protein